MRSSPAARIDAVHRHRRGEKGEKAGAEDAVHHFDAAAGSEHQS